MKQTRPVYLDLLRIRQPLPALISIAHRISGVLLFLAIPLVLNTWQASLENPGSFRSLQESPSLKLVLFLLCAAYVYHLIAGLRFLLLDLHLGLSLRSARFSSWVVLGSSLLGAILLGTWLW
jgi:succinate dehydrogenase / fumarate reductase cytochrome b subunit